MIFEAIAFLGCNSSQPTTTEKVAQKWPRKPEAFANQIVNAPLFISCPRRTAHSDSRQGSLTGELCHLRSQLRTMTGCVPATPMQSSWVVCSRSINLEHYAFAHIVPTAIVPGHLQHQIFDRIEVRRRPSADRPDHWLCRRKNWLVFVMGTVTASEEPMTDGVFVTALQFAGETRFVVVWRTQFPAFVGQARTTWLPVRAIVMDSVVRTITVVEAWATPEFVWTLPAPSWATL